MSFRLVSAAVLASGALAACGHATHSAAPAAGGGQPRNGASAPAAAPVATSDITIDNFAFGPAAITVKAGTTVTWTNKDEEPHAVVASLDGIRSQVLAGNALTYSHVFRTAGTYPYNCSIHPFMHGTVVVTS
jgi:plastocyanin